MHPTRQAILFTGGVTHPFETAAPTLASILTEAGFEVRLSEDLSAILAWLSTSPDALLVVYALRFTMTQHQKYAADRPRWGLELPIAARILLANHVSGGGGLLGVHTASICFDDWPEWRQLLGGAWQWGQSYHPPLGAVRAHLNPDHFLAKGIADFALDDEVYSELALMPDIDVVGWATPAGDVASGPGQPAFWTHRFGQGRVAYDSLGHDAQSLLQPAHTRLLQRAALWASGSDQRPTENA